MVIIIITENNLISPVLGGNFNVVSVQSTVPECVSPVRGEQGYVGRFARRVGELRSSKPLDLGCGT